MDFKKYAMGAEMNPMEALRLADESRRFAQQGVETPSDMTTRMAKYGMSDVPIMQPGGSTEWQYPAPVTPFNLMKEAKQYKPNVKNWKKKKK
jgi:hypothetical protein